MQDYYMDWGKGKKLQFLDNEDNVLPQQRNVKEFLRAYSPCRVLTETSMACKEPNERNEIIDLAHELGTEILCCATTTTAMYRRQWGLPKIDIVPDGDIADCRLFRRIALETHVLFLPIKKATVRYPGIQERSDAIDKDAVRELFGKPGEAPELIAKAFTDATGYCKVLRLFIQTAREAKTHKEYIKAIGCYGHGYHQYMRATFYRRVKTLTRRKLGVRGLRNVAADALNVAFRECQTLVRRAVDDIFWRVKQTASVTDNQRFQKQCAIPLLAA